MDLTERIERLDSGYDRVVRSDEERRRVYSPTVARVKELLVPIGLVSYESIANGSSKEVRSRENAVLTGRTTPRN